MGPITDSQTIVSRMLLTWKRMSELVFGASHRRQYKMSNDVVLQLYHTASHVLHILGLCARKLDFTMTTSRLLFRPVHVLSGATGSRAKLVGPPPPLSTL